MAENADWKQVGDVFKTSGDILKVGSFIASSGNKVDITPEDLNDLYQNISDNIPMGIGHDPSSPDYVETLGYAIKFAKNSNNVTHDGIVYDSDKFKDVVIRGYNNISPEIDFIKDTATGKIVGKRITRLAFVSNPAIDSNRTDVARFAFSAPEVPLMTDNNIPNTVSSTEPMKPTTTDPSFTANNNWAQAPPAQVVPPQQPDMNELMKNMAASIANGLTEKLGAQIEALQTELNSLKNANVSAVTPPVTEPITPEAITEANPAQLPTEVFEQFAEIQRKNQELQAKVEREEKQRYTEKLAELRSLGNQNPEKLVSHLASYEQKIATLDAFKTAMVKNTPMTSENTSPMSTEGGNRTANTPTVLSVANSLRMQLTPERAEQYAKQWGIPVR